MVFAKIFGRSDPQAEPAFKLYVALVEKARDPALYSALAVPDTVNGRFDMIVIHAMVMLRRLRGEGQAADRTGKAVLELLFTDMDRSLREMGVGDMGIGHHIKRMAKALFGRATAYEAALDDENQAALISALKDNLYRSVETQDTQVAGMADYLRRAALHLKTADPAAIMAGVIDLAVPVLGSRT